MVVQITLIGYDRVTKNDLENEIDALVRNWANRGGWKIKSIIK